MLGSGSCCKTRQKGKVLGLFVKLWEIFNVSAAQRTQFEGQRPWYVFLQFRHRSQRAMLRHSRNFAGRRVLLLFCASYEPMTQYVQLKYFAVRTCNHVPIQSLYIIILCGLRSLS